MVNKYEQRAGAIFDITQQIIEGRPHRAMRICCFRCNRAASVLANTMVRMGAEEKEKRIIARKFEHMGWQVDLNRGKHVCPDCQERKQPMKKDEPQETTVVPLNVAKKMDREDRRVIFEKLNEVYIDERHGYAPPWTDEAVAKDLGIPRAWVVQVRDEMFGPIASNSEIDEAVKAGRELIDALKKHHEQGEKLESMANAMLKQLDQIVKAVGGR